MTVLTFKDQMGRVISVNYPPQRIVSVVPSQTELLFDLGLDRQLVGATKFCVHPWGKLNSVEKIGGTKRLNLTKIKDLNPDLIIGNKEENDKDQMEELMKEFPVWMSDVTTITGAAEMVIEIGNLTRTVEKAHFIASQICEGFKTLGQIKNKLRVAYFIWKDPYMLAARETFIDDILKRTGFKNISEANRYPQITVNDLKELRPDVIFLSSEPYPFKDVHVSEMKNICPSALVMIIDGEMFSWYGSRLLQAPQYLQALVDKVNSKY